MEKKKKMQPMWIHAGDLRRHLKDTYRGKVKQMQPMQCDFALIQAGNLKAHSGENPSKCNRCDFSPIEIRGRRFKEPFKDITTTHLGEKP